MPGIRQCNARGCRGNLPVQKVQVDDVTCCQGVEKKGVKAVWVEEDKLKADKRAIYVLQDFDSSLYSELVEKSRLWWEGVCVTLLDYYNAFLIIDLELLVLWW